MAAFLSKVFSRKDKDRKKDAEDKNKDRISPTSTGNKRLSMQSQSEGRHGAEASKEKDEKDRSGLALFRPKSHHAKSPSSTSIPTLSKRADDFPQLKLDLDLPGLKNGSAQSGVGLGLAGSTDGDADLRALLVDEIVARMQIDDATLGEIRLTPAEALVLMSACARVIAARGLDTLGIMHPHWHSASPAIQRRIIALFVHSIAPATTSTTPATPSTPASATAAFASELDYTRSPHDVAAVFRWALRHLKLDGGTFDGRSVSTSSAVLGPGGTSWLAWYDAFAANERADSYPPQAFNDILLPKLPRSHVDILLATTGLISSLSAHSEINGVSGSKLAMVLGHYLLTGNRVDGAGHGHGEWVQVQGDVGREGLSLDEAEQERAEGKEGDKEEGWVKFYKQWERSGRALEHLFLAYLRNENAKEKIPKRLAELITGYPYNKSIETQPEFSRPRHTTRSYDALFVRVSGDLSDLKKDSASALQHPLRVVENALRAEFAKSDNEKGETTERNEYVSAWEEIRAAFDSGRKSTSVEGEVVYEGQRDPRDEVHSSLYRVLSDETIRLLSLRPDTVEQERGRSRETSEVAGTPTIAKFAPVAEQEEEPSMILNAQNGQSQAQSNGKANGLNGSVKAGKKPAPAPIPIDNGAIAKSGSESTASPTSPIVADWNLFSSAGFGETTTGKALVASLVETEKSRAELSPRSSVKKSIKNARSPSRSNRTKSGDAVEAAKKDSKDAKEQPKVPSAKFTTTLVTKVAIDEAFVDFWSDALLDPIASTWPVFVVCQLRSSVNPVLSQEKNVKVSWIVIEQVLTTPAPSAPTQEQETSARRASSPKPSMRSEFSAEKRPGPIGRLSSTFSSVSRKRFAFLNTSSEAKESKEKDPRDAGKKTVKGKVGEMGEIIPEEGSPVEAKVSEKPGEARKSKRSKVTKAEAVAAAAAVVGLGTAATVAATSQLNEKPQPEVPVVDVAVQPAPPSAATKPAAAKSDETAPAEEKGEKREEHKETPAAASDEPAVTGEASQTEIPEPAVEDTPAEVPAIALQATVPEPIDVAPVVQAADPATPAVTVDPAPEQEAADAVTTTPAHLGADSEPVTDGSASPAPDVHGEVEKPVVEELKVDPPVQEDHVAAATPLTPVAELPESLAAGEEVAPEEPAVEDSVQQELAPAVVDATPAPTDADEHISLAGVNSDVVEEESTQHTPAATEPEPVQDNELGEPSTVVEVVDVASSDDKPAEITKEAEQTDRRDLPEAEAAAVEDQPKTTSVTLDEINDAIQPEETSEPTARAQVEAPADDVPTSTPDAAAEVVDAAEKDDAPTVPVAEEEHQPEHTKEEPVSATSDDVIEHPEETTPVHVDLAPAANVEAEPLPKAEEEAAPVASEPDVEAPLAVEEPVVEESAPEPQETEAEVNVPVATSNEVEILLASEAQDATVPTTEEPAPIRAAPADAPVDNAIEATAAPEPPATISTEEEAAPEPDTDTPAPVAEVEPASIVDVAEPASAPVVDESSTTQVPPAVDRSDDVSPTAPDNETSEVPQHTPAAEASNAGPAAPSEDEKATTEDNMTDIVEPTAAEPSTAAAGAPAETSPETSNTAPENNDGDKKE